MLNVWFYGPGGASYGNLSMDVPRIGEQVAIAGGSFTVAVVRYYITAGPVVRVAVLLSPVAASAASVHDQQLSQAALQDMK
jgi:hypothetical protein